MNKQRIPYIDIASGILIFWVMAFHAMNTSKVFGNVDVRVALPFLTFSMPWFYYKSGQFFNAERGSEGIRKDFRKFVIPFFKWGLLGYVVYLLMHFVDGTLTWNLAIGDALDTLYVYGYIPINTPTWFILSLFLVRLCAHFLLKWKVLPIGCMIGGVVIGYCFHCLSCPWLPFLIANVAMGIAFFMMGYRFNKFENRKWLIVVCLIGYLCFISLGNSIVGHHRNVLLVGHFLLWPMFAYCGIVTFNNLCRLISQILFPFIRPITFVGENAMTLLVSHALVYMPVIYFSTLSPWETVGVVFVGYIVILSVVVIVKKK